LLWYNNPVLKDSAPTGKEGNEKDAPTSDHQPLTSKILVMLRAFLLTLLVGLGLMAGFLALYVLEKDRPTRALRAPPDTPTPTLALVHATVHAERPHYRVAIVAGHWQYDPGAVCPDGLQEVQVNLDVAREVVSLLQRRGYDAELFPEFAASLEGFEGDAFVSIHADSCNVPGASGFKVAHVENSSVPDKEARLVNCLWDEYERFTGLARHEKSITDDMRHYHNFRQISPATPGAIIELGFLLDDRHLLVRNYKIAAQGVAAGVICYLEGPDALQ
jgi:N-acetylmuramoyl-L-alanine amidase